MLASTAVISADASPVTAPEPGGHTAVVGIC
jgi:hypothetical protein